MERRVIVVEGPLAFGIRRFQAARADDVGLEILTQPLLAARLTANLDLDALVAGSARMADLALLQRRVSETLPDDAMLPRQLRDAALGRVRLAPKLFASLRPENFVAV